MRRIHVPASEEELLVLRNLLDRAGIRYFVQEDSVGALHPGFGGPFGRKGIFVGESDEKRAVDLIGSMLARPRVEIAGAEIGEGRKVRERKHKVGRVLMLILGLFFAVPFAFVVINFVKSFLGR